MLITNYQFIATIINQPIFPPARTYTANDISYPTKGNKFFEVPISYNGRNKTEGKKIRAYHFFLVLFEIIKGRFL